MPKKHRLTGVEIRNIRPSRRVQGALFSVSVSPGDVHTKATCVVSKKVSPLATDRNLVKRRCRAAIAPRLSSLPAGAFVFTAKRESLHASFGEIQKDVADLVRRIAP